MLKRVLHTGIAVADLQQAIQFYEKLGFQLVRAFEKPEPKAKAAMVQQRETVFELWQFEDESHPQVAYIRSHVAILSDDLENDVRQLEAAGFKLVIPVTEGVILRYAFLQDPAGTCYEIASEKDSRA